MRTCNRRASLPKISRKERLFRENTDWAKAIAGNVWRKLPPSFDRGDLEQEACIKLLEMCERYDPDNERGTPFQAFAYIYIRGAVLMSVRRHKYTEATADGLNPDMVGERTLQPDVQLIKRMETEAEEGVYSERSGWVKKQLHGMPALDAYLIQRHHIDGVELDDLARSMGMSRAHIGRRLAGAVKILKRAAEAKGV